MKKALSLTVLAAAIFCMLPKASAASIVLYTEDWGTTNGGSSATLGSDIGWTAVYAGGSSYYGIYGSGPNPTDSTTGNSIPSNTVYYGGLTTGESGMFYTGGGTRACGQAHSAFNAIDPT